jgi:hypothetical protein
MRKTVCKIIKRFNLILKKKKSFIKNLTDVVPDIFLLVSSMYTALKVACSGFCKGHRQ